MATFQSFESRPPLYFKRLVFRTDVYFGQHRDPSQIWLGKLMFPRIEGSLNAVT
jgi:hypothetical protein